MKLENPPGTTSVSLLLQIRSGDREAWQRFVELYGPLLLHWINRWFQRNGLEPVDQDDIFKRFS